MDNELHYPLIPLIASVWLDQHAETDRVISSDWRLRHGRAVRDEAARDVSCDGFFSALKETRLFR